MRRHFLFASLTLVVFAGTSSTVQAQRGRGGDRGGFGGRGGFGDRGGDQRRDTGAGERIMGFLDRNRNGSIDPDEMARMPGPMRDFLRSKGFDGSRPISGSNLAQLMPEMMEAVRGGRSRGGDDRGRGDSSRFGSSRFGGDGGQSRFSSSRNPKQESRPRVTVSLPESYQERDLDKDGQIGLYEWRKWNRTAVVQFLNIDRNGDGFLTPRELVYADNNGTLSSSSSVATASRTTSSSSASPSSSNSSSGSSTTTTSTTSDSSQAEASSESPEQRRARLYFRVMDKDRDGSLGPDEMGRSRIIGPKFKAAGIDMSKPMSREQFIENYVKVSTPTGG